MSACTLLLLYGLAFAAAVWRSGGRIGLFAMLMVLFSFLVSVVYWAILAGIIRPLGWPL